MDGSRTQSEPACAQEALHLLNCVAHSPYDENKCLTLLHSLRECVLNKKVKKFSLDYQKEQDISSGSKKA